MAKKRKSKPLPNPNDHIRALYEACSHALCVFEFPRQYDKQDAIDKLYRVREQAKKDLPGLDL